MTAPPTIATSPATPVTPPQEASSPDLKTLLAESGTGLWSTRIVLVAGGVSLVVVTAGLWYWQTRQAANATPRYTTQEITRGNLTMTVTANGTLQPTRSINIGSELSGTVLKVHVDVNDQVKKGQVLVELDTAKLRDQITRTSASLEASKAKVGQTLATLEEVQGNLTRFEEVAKLSDSQVPSKTELDGARASVARAQGDAVSARAGVTDAQAALSTDIINQSKASIRAPSDGVVLTRSVDPGNAVAASLQAVTLLTVAEDLANLRLQVYVDEADVGSVQIGQNASFSVSAYPTRYYPAQITRVAFGSTITDNVVTYITLLGVKNTDLSLRPGMTATATITAMHRDNVLLVPNTALRFTPSTGGVSVPNKNSLLSSMMPRGQGSSRKPAASGANLAAVKQVWVLQNQQAVAVAVTPGISDGHMTEIVGGDLQPGMQVITDQQVSQPP